MGESELSTSARALGLIETRGLVGVLEAADTAAKAADVQLMGIERIGGGFVSLRLSGEVAAVQAAVRAGSAAARDVSELVSAHVIPSPHLDMDSISSSAQSTRAEKKVSRAAVLAPIADTVSVPDDIDPTELARMPVTRLRQLARRIPGVRLQGREVSRANKQQLLAELQRVLGHEEG